MDPLNLESQTKLNVHSRGSPEFSNENLRQIGQWLPLSYDRTNKQRVHRVGTDNLQRKGEQYLGKRGVLHSWEHYTHRTFLTFMECILKDLSITIYHV